MKQTQFNLIMISLKSNKLNIQILLKQLPCLLSYRHNLKKFRLKYNNIHVRQPTRPWGVLIFDCSLYQTGNLIILIIKSAERINALIKRHKVNIIVHFDIYLRL